MTKNQIDARRVREEERSNAAREAETKRANRAKEGENRRSNRAGEQLKERELYLKHASGPLTKLIGSAWMPRAGNARAATATDKAAAYAGAQHPEWYDKYPELTTGVARYPTSLTTASGVKSNHCTTNGGEVTFSEAYLMVCDYLPTFGDTEVGAASMINTAAKKIYSNVRHANSGSSNYEFQDLMLNLMAIDGIYMMIAWLVRLYGSAKMYQANNRSIPKAILESYGIEEVDLLNNVGPLYNSINMLINKASMFVQPADMAITSRHMWLAGAVLANPDKPYSEIYMYQPKQFPVFAIDEVTGAGSIMYVDPPAVRTIDGLVAWVNARIDALLLQEDSGIMAGDILKAYGDNVFKLSPIPIDYSVEFVTDTNALEQFMNNHVITASDGTSFSWLVGYNQTDGALYAELPPTSWTNTHAVVTARTHMANGALVRTFDKDLTPAQIVSRVRGINSFRVSSTAVSIERFADIIPLSITVYSTQDSSGTRGVAAAQYMNYFAFTIADSITTLLDVLQGTFRCAQFKYAPTASVVLYNAENAAQITAVTDITDRAHFTVIPFNGLGQMHDVAINSLFYNPGLAKFG